MDLRDKIHLHRNWIDLIVTAAVFCVVVIVSLIFVGIGIKGYSPTRSAWAAALIWSLSSLVSGFAAGFLFGIPRVLQQATLEGGGKSKNERDYQLRVNTNLEQISDWLTKIIVGVGLVQLHSTPGFLKKVGSFASQSFSSNQALSESAASFGVGIVSLFVAQGFLGGYTLTRLFLAGAFGRADQDAIGTGTVAAPNATDTTYSPASEARKILATLWRYQDRTNKEKRWTFTVLPTSPEYPSFKKGLEELFQRGLVTLAPNGQVMLSDAGIEYLQNRDAEYQTTSDIYQFN